MTQCERIIDYLNEKGSITPIDALREFRCMRLASRICDLRKAGYPIGKRTISAKNSYGETVSFAEYYIEGEI